MKIYEQLGNAREMFHNLKLRKTGKNKFQGYEYFELSDFLIPAMKCLKDHGLVPVISFGTELATMTIYSTEAPGSSIVITSPMSEANMKGNQPVQNLGAVETYQRRYLWVAAMEIVEHDALDSAEPQKPEPKTVSNLADQAQKMLIKDHKEAGTLPTRWVEWCKDTKKWKGMTKQQAAAIINDAKGNEE